jgi:uncharacterized OB-fold protein
LIHPRESGAYPAVEGLFTWPSESPQLIAGHCDGCGTPFFPLFAELHRPNCPGGPLRRLLLSKQGTLLTFTVHQYRPPPPFRAPDPFVPFPIGVVGVPEGLAVPGQIIGCSVDGLAIGMPVEIVIGTLYVDEDGREALTWQLRPVEV